MAQFKHFHWFHTPLFWKRLYLDSSLSLSVSPCPSHMMIPVFSVDKFLFLFSFVCWQDIVLPCITVFNVGGLNANSSPKGSYVWTHSHQWVVLFEKAGEPLAVNVTPLEELVREGGGLWDFIAWSDFLFTFSFLSIGPRWPASFLLLRLPCLLLCFLCYDGPFPSEPVN